MGSEQETKQCQKHEINYLATYSDCPYCKREELKAAEAAADAANLAKEKGDKKPRGTPSRRSVLHKSRMA